MSRAVEWLRTLSWPRRFLLVFLAWAVGSSLTRHDVTGAMVALVVGALFLVPREGGVPRSPLRQRRSSSVFVRRSAGFAGMASVSEHERSEANPDATRRRPTTGTEVTT